MYISSKNNDKMTAITYRIIQNNSEFNSNRKFVKDEKKNKKAVKNKKNKKLISTREL